MKATRDSFGEKITQLGEVNPDVVVLDADLSKSTKSIVFAEKFPERFFQMGIAEANMIGTAAGLALSGKIPFACSFGTFLTGRYDQIRMSIGYNQANVKLIGTHAGVAIGEDGHSQMGLEDLAVLRSLPNITLLQPADHYEAMSMLDFAVEYEGPVYLRLTRQKMPFVCDENYKYQLGKFQTLKTGQNIAFVASGELVHSCQKAIEQSGENWTLVNASTIKPVDEPLIKELAASHRWLVTAEDHSVTGGLGSAVAEVMAEIGASSKLHRIGVHGFGESGSPEDVLKAFKLDANGVLETVKKLCQ